MSIIAFWSNGREETAKTLSIAAISTYMAIQHNYKILSVSTTYNDDTLQTCFWRPERQQQTVFPELGVRKNDIASGVEGLAKAISSNKVTPEIITNYTKIVFKDRLEILLGPSTSSYQEYEKFIPMYTEILKSANKYYDLIFVDLNKGLDKEGILDVLTMADMVVINITQRLKTIDDVIALKEKYPIFNRKNIMYLIGRYDKFSKYSSKNIARYMGERKEIATVPYNTLFFEACNEGKIVDYFLRYRRIDSEDRNAIFINEVNKTCDKIIYKLQELHMRN